MKLYEQPDKAKNSCLKSLELYKYTYQVFTQKTSISVDQSGARTQVAH